MKKEIDYKKIVQTTMFVLLALLCFTIIRSTLAKPETYSSIINILDEKKSNVTKLLAASSSASTLITLIPDDVGTPIATKLADLSTIFLGILAVLYLEKYLLSIIGTIVSIIFGIACLLLAISLWTNKEILKNISMKMMIIGLIAISIIPISTWVTSSIDNTYNTSIEESINQAVDSSEETNESKEDETIWQQIVNSFSDVVTSITSAAESSYKWAQNTLNNFVEATAIMLVTSCLIPVITLIVAVWLAKTFIEKISK